jgi:hypothetical protein
MVIIVYVLCAATALACSILLLRGFLKNRARLLLWSGLCFAFLALDNVFLFFDQIVVPDVNLAVWRSPTALLGISLLLFGLVWDTGRRE